MTTEQIKTDLMEIRYYYAHKSSFDGAVSFVGTNTIIDKVNKYNGVMQTAPARLYDLYVGLYVNANTQEALAEKINYTPQYVQRLNKKLILFLQSAIKD